MNGADTQAASTIPSVATIRRIVTRRSWIAVPIVAACTGLLFAQESKLDVMPATVYMVRTYEMTSPLPHLAALGIDPSAFAPMLSSTGTMARFNDEELGRQRAERTGNPAELRVEQTTTDFAAIKQEFQESRSIYTMIVAGTNVYNIICDKVDYDECATASDGGAVEFAALLNESFRTATNDVAVLIGKRADAIAAVERSGLSDAERATLVELEASMRSQVTVLEDVAAGSTYDATMIGEYVINQAATVSTVKTSTYALGVGIGLLISVLVLLQMAVLYERRQRTTAR